MPKASRHFRLMGTRELAKEMNLSEPAVRALASWGAPFIAKKSHPELIFDWIKKHPEKIGKLE